MYKHNHIGNALATFIILMALWANTGMDWWLPFVAFLIQLIINMVIHFGETKRGY